MASPESPTTWTRCSCGAGTGSSTSSRTSSSGSSTTAPSPTWGGFGIGVLQRYIEITHDPLLFSVAQGIFWLSPERLSRCTLHLKEGGEGSLYTIVLFRVVLHRLLCEDSHKIPEGRTSIYILHLSGLLSAQVIFFIRFPQLWQANGWVKYLPTLHWGPREQLNVEHD